MKTRRTTAIVFEPHPYAMIELLVVRTRTKMRASWVVAGTRFRLFSQWIGVA